MRNTLIMIALGLAMLAWLPGLAYAESSWWDKGADILKNLGEKTETTSVTTPGNAEIGDAFKQALRIGANNVVNQLGVTDGFNADPAIHIPLPEELMTIKKMLSKFGMGQLVDDLELKLNRAAEAATPKAKALFLQAITDMTFADVKNIYEGPENSATEYFKRSMSPSLKKEMQPVIEKTLSQVGAIQAYNEVVSQYKALPFVPDVQADLTNHVVQTGMEGIFHYLAKEEASIRRDPAKQTTALLKKVFGVK
ncbi:MAG: DUF4197 domain-containing protein [Gammaproteobacteria bacterium]|nr:DUF4197 domain-containing protein [Gammaproteobacteria bacterium]